MSVSKIIQYFYGGVVPSHEFVRCRRPPGQTGAEATGTYKAFEYGEDSPLRIYVKHGNAVGIEVHPYILPGFAAA